MEHQNVLYGVLSGVQQRDGVFTDVHLQIDLQRLICTGRKERGSTPIPTRLSDENIVRGPEPKPEFGHLLIPTLIPHSFISFSHINLTLGSGSVRGLFEVF